MAQRVTETIYYVEDLDAAVRFYQSTLGYALEEKQDWGWAALSVDGSARIGLLLSSFGRKEGESTGELPRPRVSIQTGDINAEVARLRAAGVQVDDLVGEPGTVRGVNFYDPDGNAFFLWEDATA